MTLIIFLGAIAALVLLGVYIFAFRMERQVEEEIRLFRKGEDAAWTHPETPKNFFAYYVGNGKGITVGVICRGDSVTSLRTKTMQQIQKNRYTR